MNFADFAIDSDSDSESGVPPPARPAPTSSPPPPPPPPLDTPAAPQDEADDDEPRLLTTASQRDNLSGAASVNSFNNPPYEPLKPAPAVERTPRTPVAVRSHRSSAAASGRSSQVGTTPPILSAPASSMHSRRGQSIHDALHEDADRQRQAEQDREQLREIDANRRRGKVVTDRGSIGGGSGSTSWVVGGGAEDGDEVENKRASAAEEKPEKKKKFNKELFERLSKPLAIHRKYDEQKQLEQEEKAAEQQKEEQRQKEALAPVTQVKWRVHTRRFQLSDLEQHNDHYHTN